jgi:hypothetical protein
VTSDKEILIIDFMIESNTLENFLVFEMSRRNMDLVADLIFQKPEIFEELFSVFMRNEEPVSRRAAWVIDTVTEKKPELLASHLRQIIDKLHSFSHDGLKRHSLRMLARSPIPSGDQMGELMTICFDWLLSPGESVSVKVYCMELLYRISQVEPDLKKELADSIEWRLNEETAGFKNRGQKLLKKLYKEMEK